MIPFSLSIAALSLVQGALVAVPRAWGPLRSGVTPEDSSNRSAATSEGPPGSGTAPEDLPGLARLRSRRWALIPPVSVIGFVLIARLAEQASAEGLTYLALVAVPALAALALGWLMWDVPPARPARALLVAPLFALAWADRGGLAGETAALILTALSCAALGALLAAVTPARWLAGGIVAMAVADTALVVSDLLQKPNNALNAAHPAAGLPQLQRAVFGSALIGYGDLFVAGVLGALLATAMGPRLQLEGAALTVLLALGFDLLFFFVDELPATVPPALTLLALTARRKGLTRTRARTGGRRAPEPGEDALGAPPEAARAAR
jgi:hypothetical protein